MIELLQNIEWGFWEVTAAIVFGVASLVWALWERRRNKIENSKELVYSVISNSLLVNPSRVDTNRLKVVFDGEEVENLWITIFEVANQGSVPITSGDFESNLAIFCGDSASLLSAEVVSTHPGDLNAEIRIDNHSAVIKPLLLNSGDSIRVKLVGTNFARTIKLQGRIVGIPKFVEKDTSIVNVSTLLEALKLSFEIASRYF